VRPVGTRPVTVGADALVVLAILVVVTTAAAPGAVSVVEVVVVGVTPAGAGGVRLRARLGRGEQTLHRGRFVDLGGPYEVLVEHHGGEVLVRAPAVDRVLRVPAVLERPAPHVVRHAFRVDLGDRFGQGECKISPPG
jgi:hypothetical protein